MKTPERLHWHHSGVFIVDFEHISHIVLVFLLLTFNMYLPPGFNPFHTYVSFRYNTLVLSQLTFA